MSITHAFAGIAVADYGAALAWYERLLGRPPDVIVTENKAMWQVAEASWVYVVGDATRAGHALFALLVDDLEDQVAALAQRGLATGEIETAPGVVRKVVLSDPEGDRITVGEEPQHKRLRSPRSRERRLIYVSPAHAAPQGWPTPTSVMFSGRTARIPA